ncbi:MAG: acetolactate synthase small subunit [Chloroflexi bacterium HGW-Chloroflexi-1]|nr:MAG: acetolactate synthase small subunit [Chloroflexi bacterium HGW-Chloroflexi-1]
MALVDRRNNGTETTRVLVALVENKPGVLTRVASLFRRRNFNIESLTVGHTDSPDVSRMTIVIDATKTNAVMVERNLYKMVNIIDVQDVTHSPAVLRDLALIKVKIDGQTRFEVMQLVNVYRAKVVDICADSMIVEVTGPEAKVNSLADMLKPYGIIEMVRTGLVAMVRGSGYWSGMPPANDNGALEEAESGVVSLGM